MEKFCFRPGITQDEALGWCLGDDSDTMHHVQDTMVQNPRRHILFEQNPCHCGFSFYGIRQGWCATIKSITYSITHTDMI